MLAAGTPIQVFLLHIFCVTRKYPTKECIFTMRQLNVHQYIVHMCSVCVSVWMDEYLCIDVIVYTCSIQIPYTYK